MIFQLLGCNGGRITDWQPFRNSLVLEGYFIPHRVHPWQRKLRNNNSINRCTSWPKEKEEFRSTSSYKLFPIILFIYVSRSLLLSFFENRLNVLFPLFKRLGKTQEDQQNGVVLFLKIYSNPYKSVYIIFQLPRGGMLTRRWKAAR